MEEAAKLLEVGETVVNRLVKLEWIGAHEERNENTGKLRMALLKDDVLAFGRAYIPVSEVWRRRDGRLLTINPLLLSHGLEPAFNSETLRCTFYPRAEVGRIFPPPLAIRPAADRSPPSPSMPKPLPPAGPFMPNASRDLDHQERSYGVVQTLSMDLGTASFEFAFGGWRELAQRVVLPRCFPFILEAV